LARIGVIGGGVIGLCSAVRLAAAGHAVTVFEPDIERQAASWGNAGHIATEQTAPLASPASVLSAPGRLFAFGGALALPPSQIGTWGPFVLRLLAASTPSRFRRGQIALAALLEPALDDWLDLAAAIGRSELVRDTGHYVAWETEASARRGRAAWARVGTGRTSISDVPPPELARLQAMTTMPLHGAVRFSGTGQILDTRALADGLEQVLIAAGGVVIREAANPVLSQGMAAVPGHNLDQVLVTAGVRSRVLMATFGHDAPMIAERGYHIRAHAPLWPADRPPTVFEDRSIIVTRFNDFVQVAGFVELGSPDAPPDPRKWDRLERHARELDLSIEPPFTRWMGCRPTLPDYLPAIGRSERVPNLYYAFGHQHLGLTLAATTARIVAALVDRQPPPVDVSPFSLSRFERRSRP
jgi:glycine/D-amino acid oxidase-like deaminating enzyme